MIDLTRSLCPEAEQRAAMSDGDFWDYVFNRNAVEPDWDDDPDASLPTPCPVCRSTDACGYDAEGRPMIHALGDDES